MWSPGNQHMRNHKDGADVNTGAYESPTNPNGQIATPITERAMFPSPSASSYTHDAHARTLSHKSTFSTLPEVTNSPNPFYDSSPIVCDPEIDGGVCSGSRGAATTSASDLGVEMITGMGTEDTEKEMYVSTEPGPGSRGSKFWRGFGGLFSRGREENVRGGAFSTNSATNRADPSDANTRLGPTIWGMQRKRFFLLMCGMFFVVVAVAVGVGLGVSMGVANKSNDTSATNDGGYKPAETPTSTSTNSKYPTPTGTVNASSIKCPAANHAEYAAQEYENATSGVGTNFLVICNTDYSAMNGTVDLISDEVKDVAECFDWCSATTGCVGAGFAFYNEKYTCWLKSTLGEPTILSGFYFGVSEAEYSS